MKRVYADTVSPDDFGIKEGLIADRDFELEGFT